MLSGVVAMCFGVLMQASPVAAPDTPPNWLENYGQAMKVAKQDRRMLLVYFHSDKVEKGQDALLQKLTTDTKLRPYVKKHVLVRIPISQRAVVGGKKILLIRHSAFSELEGKAGLAIIDFEDPGSKYYGNVVSVYPLSLPGAMTTPHLTALLSLPSASLTQRTLILAVRLHPESPASTDGTFLTTLAKETESHSLYQASITNQGHHNWESRFHRISARLPGGLPVKEVCAESWPGEGLLAAAIDCVQSWRQSSGHWSAVRSSHKFYGYDMKRGRNGIWYATGIFSSRN